MIKQLFFIFAIFMVMGLASAVTDVIYVKVNTNGNIQQTEFNSTYQNLTSILRPDGVTEIIGKNMQKMGYAYNYSYYFGQLGTYHINGCSDISCWTYPIVATPSGFVNVGTFLFIFIIIIVLIFILGFKLENVWIMWFGSTLTLILGFFIIKYGVDIIKDTQTTWVIGLCVWAIGIYTIFLNMQEMLKQWN